MANRLHAVAEAERRAAPVATSLPAATGEGPLTVRNVLALQRAAGNGVVARLARARGQPLARACCSACASGRHCEDDQAEDIETIAKAQRALAGAVRARSLARLTAEEKLENLSSPRLAGNPRLERAFDNSPAIHIGESGDGVRLVQEALVADGFPMPESTRPTGELDGGFGQETFDTVKLFQEKHGLAGVDGIVGRETLREMDRLEAERPLLKPQPGGEPSVQQLPGGLEILVPGSEEAPEEVPRLPNVLGAPPKPPVRIVPRDPKKPLDLKNFKCASKQKLKIEIYTGPLGGDLLISEPADARAELEKRDIILDVVFKPISSPRIPMGIDLPPPQDPKSPDPALVESLLDLCELVQKTVRDVGHETGRLPVFFLPVSRKITEVGDDLAAGLHMKTGPDERACAPLGVPTGLAPLILINTREDCKGVLLHELGHAVGTGHFEKTFIHPGCGEPEDVRHTMFQFQVRKFCNNPFK